MDGWSMPVEMSPKFPANTVKRLGEAENIWIATVRKDGRPHLVPVWFVFLEGIFWVCIAPDSVKAGNIADNPAVVLALEDGSEPVICEGLAAGVDETWPKAVVEIFYEKYDWDILSDEQYTSLVKIIPTKLLGW
jgi:nitroimidazol reductase NimA-like FMN-containing flavoprotein (pyridoxamine 5'-phosphate oxidase superfamily)